MSYKEWKVYIAGLSMCLYVYLGMRVHMIGMRTRKSKPHGQEDVAHADQAIANPRIGKWSLAAGTSKSG